MIECFVQRNKEKIQNKLKVAVCSKYIYTYQYNRRETKNLTSIIRNVSKAKLLQILLGGLWVRRIDPVCFVSWLRAEMERKNWGNRKYVVLLYIVLERRVEKPSISFSFHFFSFYSLSFSVFLSVLFKYIAYVCWLFIMFASGQFVRFCTHLHNHTVLPCC